MIHLPIPVRSTLALIVLLTAGPALAQPAAFSIQAGKQYDSWPTFVAENVPSTIHIDALDAEGNVLTSYEGTASASGIFVERGGGVEPLAAIGPFREGRLMLAPAAGLRYFVRGSEVRVWDGAASSSVSVRPVRAPGWASLLPPVLAIALAIATRQVFIALFVGVMAGAFFVFQYGQDAHPLAFFLRTVDAYLPFVVGYNAVILLFTFALGGLIAMMARAGGTAGLVALLAPFARTPRSGQLTTWALGMAIFFDDYANCYIVGPMMRARTDLLRISREKLAYIVDSTAAPIASIMVVSTWVGVEIGYIEDALGLVGSVQQGDGMRLFWSTMPYRFYPLLAIVMVFLVALLRRDFGPMLAAERRAISSGKLVRDGSAPMADKDLTEMMEMTRVAPAPSFALLPLAVLVSIVLGGVIYGVVYPEDALDSTVVFLWGTITACIVAAAMIVGRRVLTVQETFETWVLGAKSMVMACAILTLAWAIGQVCKDLRTGDYVVAMTQGLLSPRLVPLLTFTLAAVISFSTGTSYGTMAILMPIMVPVAWALTAGGALPPETAEAVRLATVGSVLAGAIFGDHCSPISDTTIMSSIGAAADHMDHVRTQLPYALLIGALAAAGCVLVGYGASPWLALVGGLAAVVGMLLVVGRNPEAV
jgi:Na+/H+ antiporter NhaC